MPLVFEMSARNVRARRKSNVADPECSPFPPLNENDIRSAFATPANVPPILSLGEAAQMVKLRPQTLKRKVSE